MLWWLPNRLRATTLENLERCLPELSRGERLRLARSSLMSLGKSVGESGAVWTWSEERLVELEEEIQGQELLDAAMASHRGVLALAPHLGNWEYLSFAAQRRCRVTSLYRPPRVRELDDFMRRRRERFGARMVPADARGIRLLLEAIRQGEIGNILPDQEPLKRHGVFAPFFNVPALTMTLVGRVVRRLRPTIIVAYALRTESGKFRVVFEPGPEGLEDLDVVRAATRLNQAIERCARRCPEQYVWSYRRFRTRPPEELTP